MYTFYTDKPTNFECNISLQGAKLSKSKARLVLESDDVNFIFYGTIDTSGKCIIPVSRLRNRLDENTVGKAKLEVIAEDTYFEPWEDQFEIKTNKKVTVEVKNNSKPPIVESTDKKVKVAVKNNSKIDHLSDKFISLLEHFDINAMNISKKKNELRRITEKFQREFGLTEPQRKELIDIVITKLLK